MDCFLQADHSRRWRGPELCAPRIRQWKGPFVADFRKHAAKGGGGTSRWANLFSAWNHPECEASSVPVAPRYFDVNMAEWRPSADACFGVVWERKFFQRHLLLIFLVEHSPLLKTLDRDRFIGDRRPQNGTERLIRKCHLPSLHDSDASCNQVIVSSVFISVTFQIVTTLIDEERLQRQVLGLRVPVSWFRNIEDASLDLLPIEGFESWVSSDLAQNPIQEAVAPGRYCQIAVAAVTMGDLNAVYAVEAAHRRQLLSVGSSQTRTMLIPGCVFTALP